MEDFRLSYPAHIYVTVAAETESEAKELFRLALDPHLASGLIVDLDNDDCSEERLYVGTDANGDVDPGAIEIEDVETDDGDN